MTISGSDSATGNASTSSSIMNSAPVSYVTAPAYHGLVTLARQASLSLFSRLNQPEAKGLLEIIEDDQSTLYGDPTSLRAHRKTQSADVLATLKGVKQAGTLKATHAVLDVKKDAFWLRLVVGGDLGFAESYMTGEVDTPDLGAVFKVGN